MSVMYVCDVLCCVLCMCVVCIVCCVLCVVYVRCVYCVLCVLCVGYVCGCVIVSYGDQQVYKYECLCVSIAR